MTISELKEYIYNNQKVEFILNEIGCSNIKYHTKGYYACSNYNGDNPTAINVYNTPFLSTVNYTRDMINAISKNGDRHNKNVKNNEYVDIITLVQYNTHKDFYSAIKYLHNILGVPFIQHKHKNKQIVKNDPLSVFTKYRQRTPFSVNDFNYCIHDDNIIKNYMPYLHISWVKEGITQRARDKFNIGYSFDRNRIVIPHRIWNGNDEDYIGIMGRTTIDNYELFGIPKYFPFIPYSKSINIYGLQENHESIRLRKQIVVYESEKSVLKRYSRFDETGVAIMGSSLSDEQVRILIGLNVDIIICMDKGVDEEYIKEMCKRFVGLRNVYYIFDKWDLLQDKMSPADASEKVYQFLLKHKIKFER